jgi:hypothetical protein
MSRRTTPHYWGGVVLMIFTAIITPLFIIALFEIDASFASIMGNKILLLQCIYLLAMFIFAALLIKVGLKPKEEMLEAERKERPLNKW